MGESRFAMSACAKCGQALAVHHVDGSCCADTSRLKFRLAWVKKYPVLPERCMDALERYIFDRIEPGGFMRAVLESDLMEAVGRADDENIRLLPKYAWFIYNHVPYVCCGSKERVAAWLNEGERMKIECWSCAHKREIPGDAHISCAKPDPFMIGSSHGIARGWFCYPLNFDPTWKRKMCANYERVCGGKEG